MGWILLGLIGLIAAAALWWLGVPRRSWTIVVAALMIGATGYAVQGSPGYPGVKPRPVVDTMSLEPEIVELRNALFGRYSSSTEYLVAADAMMRAGSVRAAVQVTQSGLRKNANSAVLWTELGSTLATHDGNVSPAALFAFQQAMRIAPQHPGPPFFLGLAYVEAGELERARPFWMRAFQLSPPGASYRIEIAKRLFLLDRFIQMVNQQPQQGR